MTQSIIRYIITLALGYLVGKGIITQSQSDSMLPSLAGDFAIIATGLVAVAWSFLEKATKGALDIYFPAKAATNPGQTTPLKLIPMALALGLGGASVLLMGCGATSVPISPVGTPAATTTSTASTAIEAALPLVRTGAAVATGAVLDFAVSQPSTRTKLANEMYASASAIYSMTGTGTFPTVAQFQANILAYGGSQADANYAQYSAAVAALYASYYPTLIAHPNIKTATDLLNAIAGGIEDATQSYVTTQPVVSLETPQNSSMALRVAQLMERASNRE
jgi:hypothetical protein